jgi:Icc-related predicted phosphoesterase
MCYKALEVVWLAMRILSLSDTVVSSLYSPMLRSRHAKVDVIVGCGDLPYHYLEYVYNGLSAPLFFVRGNHDKVMEYSSAGQRSGPLGGIDLHRRMERYNGLLLAGVEGCLRYRPGPFQYTQTEMWLHVARLIPGLLRNRVQYGRYLDIFVTHAPSSGIHDAEDLPHRGIEAFGWLVKVFQPSLHLHGHIHVYYPWQEMETRVGTTRVINSYTWRETVVDIPTR